MKLQKLILIPLLAVLFLTGCSGQNTTATNDSAESTQTETVGFTSTPTESVTADPKTAAATSAPSTQAPEPTIASANVDPNTTYDYEVREIWTENNGNRIYGEAYIPVTDGRSPLILFSHGLGSNHESGESYAKKVAPRGFAVYTWDFPGGSSVNNENRSDGSNLEMSVMTEASDLDAIIKTAKTWDFVDTNRIFLAGGSQGGLVTAIGGVRHEDEVAGLILLYPAFGMVDLGAMYSEDMPEENQVGSIIVGRRFFKDMEEADVRDQLQNFTKPVLILQGSEDGLVTPESSEAAAQSYPDAEYHLINGAGHGFSGEHHDLATNYALDFMAKHY